MGQAPTVHAPISCCTLLTVMLTWQTLRKLILIAGLVFVYPGTTTQVWVSLLIACLFLGLTTYHMPCLFGSDSAAQVTMTDALVAL